MTKLISTLQEITQEIVNVPEPVRTDTFSELLTGLVDEIYEWANINPFEAAVGWVVLNELSDRTVDHLSELIDPVITS